MLEARPLNRSCRPWPRMPLRSSHGKLRLQRMRAGSQAEPDRRNADPQAHRQARDQRPGCPPIADVMMGCDSPAGAWPVPALDNLGRPKGSTASRARHCYRRANYDAGLFVEAWDDENARKAIAIQDGLQRPSHYNACSVVKWNEARAIPFSPVTDASVAAKRASGQRPLYQHLPHSRLRCREHCGHGWHSGRLVTLAGVATHAVVTTYAAQRDRGSAR